MKCRPNDTGDMEQGAEFRRGTLSRFDMDAMVAAQRAIADRKSFEESAIEKSSTAAQFKSYVQFASGEIVEVRRWIAVEVNGEWRQQKGR